jgi:hypothetical protein
MMQLGRMPPTWREQLGISTGNQRNDWQHYFLNNQKSEVSYTCVGPIFYTYQLSLNKEPKDTLTLHEMGPDFRDRWNKFKQEISPSIRNSLSKMILAKNHTTSCLLLLSTNCMNRSRDISPTLNTQIPNYPGPIYLFTSYLCHLTTRSILLCTTMQYICTTSPTVESSQYCSYNTCGKGI